MERTTRLFALRPETRRNVLAVARLGWHDMNRTNLFSRASAMAYMTLGSIVPSLAVFFAIIAIFQPVTDPNTQWFAKFRAFILTNLAPDSGQQTVAYIERFLANLDVATIGVTGFASALVILILLLRNVEEALNEIWEVTDARPILRRFVFFWTALTLGAFSMSLMLGFITKFNLSNLLPFVSGPDDGNPFFEALLTLAFTFAGFTALYKVGPNCKVPWRPALIGAATATVMLRLASTGYTIFATNNSSYQNIYGAISAVPLFLLWLYLLWLVILFGALVTWRVQQGVYAGIAARADAKAAIDPVQKSRQQQLQALAPVICVLSVYQRFLAAPGHGPTPRELARSMDMPLPWILDACRTALAHGLIIMRHPLGPVADHDDEALASLEAFPTYPAEQMTVDDIIARCSAPSRAWLAANRKHLPLDLTPFGLFGTRPADDKGTTVAAAFTPARPPLQPVPPLT